MKKSGIRFILILILLYAFFNNVHAAYKTKVKKLNYQYRYTEESQVPFVQSTKSYVQSNNIQQGITTLNTQVSSNQIYYSNDEYIYRPLIEDVKRDASLQNSNITILSTLQRANNSTNDDELPGDPGQFPIGDGGYIIALALAVYTFFKFRLTFKK